MTGGGYGMKEREYDQHVQSGGAYPPRVSPFDDQSEQAADHWAHGVQQPRQQAYDGYWGAMPQAGAPVEDWSISGYHMEDAACDRAEPLDDANDGCYLPEEALPYLSPDYDLPLMAEDDGVDEHLADVRSPHVKDHNSSFWDKADGSRTASGVPASGKDAAGDVPPHRDTRSGPVTQVHAQPGARAVVLVIAIVLVLGAVGAVVYNSMFSIHSITVQGNRTVQSEEIIASSGVRIGMNVLMLDIPAITDAVEANRYLKLVRVDHDNHNVVLQVYERSPMAYIRVNGIYYTMDNRGMVLEEYGAEDALPKGLVHVEDLPVHGCLVGRTLNITGKDTADAYLQLMLEIKAMGLQNTIAAVNLGDLNNLLLDTSDGFFVQLGDATYLHGKFRAMMLTRTELIGQGYSGGTINVSNYAKPSYKP